MTELDERTIRERAHRLWEQAGKPQGMDQHLWCEAKRQLREELVVRFQHSHPITAGTFANVGIKGPLATY
jgi:hypothetical protein